jgi:hypothetical protein
MRSRGGIYLVAAVLVGVVAAGCGDTSGQQVNDDLSPGPALDMAGLAGVDISAADLPAPSDLPLPADFAAGDFSGVADFATPDFSILDLAANDLTMPDLAMSDLLMPGDLGPNPCQPPTSITLSPANLSTNVVAGTAFMQAYTATAHYASMADQDVTSSAFFSVDDASLGAFSGAQFSWSGDHGGSANVRATSCGVTGSTPLTLHMTSVSATTGTDASAAAAQFMSAGASTQASCAPTLVYPPDGVLIPPNTNVIEVHFVPGGGGTNNLFEISFENASTDVRVYTSCSGTSAADGLPLNGGCVFELTQAEWDAIARTNRGGNPLAVKVRALGCDGTNAGSSAPRNLSFASEDLVGTVYYFASMRVPNASGGYNSGGVFRFDYGQRDQPPTPVLTPASASNPMNRCIGCHDISRDGRKMAFNYDDNDDDDDYSDPFTDILDIASATPVAPISSLGTNDFPPGFQTWNRSHSLFLLADGFGNQATPPGAFRLVTPTAATTGFTPAGMLRGTTPDWAADDSQVVFAAPPNVLIQNPFSTAGSHAGFWKSNGGSGANDLWFGGASLYSAAWNGTSNSLGAPTLLAASDGTTNYYYPSYSPDGSLIAFNFAPEGANFHNPKARVQVVSAGQSNPTPVDLTALNDSGNLTNSWARWSPFVQRNKGGQIAWITLSSTRNYGLRVINDGKVNCYPRESPTGTGAVCTTSSTCSSASTCVSGKCTGVGPLFVSATSNSLNPVCTRTQLWMAAIRLDANAVATGQDVSSPAFYVPFQDPMTNNHLAQWTQQAFSGACTTPSDCGGSACCVMGGCTSCPMPVAPAPVCSIDANCATGECCSSGQCQPCSGTDGGTPAPSGCRSCLDCNGLACIAGQCAACTSSTQCCAPSVCNSGRCM